MNNKIAGSILLGFSGLVATIGIVGTQIAYALVKAGFYAGQMTGEIPPDPEGAALHWFIIVSIGMLAILGIYLLFAPEESNRKLEN